MVQGGRRPKWRILDQITADLYILSWPQNSHVRYAPLYIHSFVLCATRKIREATQFNRQHHRYEEIEDVPDRLRWCRHSKGLMQAEVAKLAGVTSAVYMDIECGTTQHIPLEMAKRLAQFYDVPVTDFLDEFNRFLYDGQARRIRAYRESLSMDRKTFATHTGIPLTSLRCWENDKKVISRKCWERYFKGRA